MSASSQVAPGPCEKERSVSAYCAWPDARHKWLLSQLPKLDGPVVRRFLVDMGYLEASPHGPGCTTVETAYAVHVKELCYPGGRWNFADADDKWLYAFRAGMLVVEAYCVRGDVWEGSTVVGSTRRPWRSVCGVRLDPGPRDKRHEYTYLLSPVQLTPEAIQDIQQGELGAYTHDLGLAAEVCDTFDKTVYVPDPMRWACEVNERYYQPRLRAMLAWEFDEGIRSYGFVANVLKRWIDDGDRVGAQKELRRTPESWLNEQMAGWRGAERKAVEAAAYLAHCVDSQDYAAIEKSCIARGEEALELAAVALHQATAGALLTEPGRKLAQQLVGNPKRLPARLIFQGDGPKLPDQWFERRRFGQKALLAIFGELFPASIERDLSRAERLKAKEAPAAIPGKRVSRAVQESLALRERAMKYLENLKVQTELNHKETRILGNLRANRPIAKGAPRDSAAARSVDREWQKLIRIEEVQRAPAAPPTKGELAVAKAEKLSKRFEPYAEYAKRLTATAGSVVEVANFCIAVVELKKAKEELARGEGTAEEVQKKRWSVAGAVADFVEHAAGVASELVERDAEMAGRHVEHEARVAEALLKGQLSEISKTGMFTAGAKAVGHVAGFIGGAIDMVDFEGQLVEAIGEYDYGKAVGRSMQVAGSAGSAAGAAGAALVAGGFLVAKWLSLNANQTFASRCFLGKHWEEEAKDVSLSGDQIPTKNPKVEAKVLVDLLCQFELSCFADIDDWRVFIHPGYVEDDWTFEVTVEQYALHVAPEHYSLTVDLKTDQVVQTAGLPLKAGEVRRDKAGHVDLIEINLEEVKSRETGFGWQRRGGKVLVRLMSPGDSNKPKQRVPYEGSMAVKIGLPNPDRVFSMDRKGWTRLGEAHREVK